MKHMMRGIVVGLVVALFFGFAGNAAGIPYGYLHQTSAPSALIVTSSSSSPNTIVNPANAAVQDNIAATMPHGSDAAPTCFVQTGGFSSTYGFFGTYPPDNATIWQVTVMVVAWNGASSPKNMGVSFTYDGGTIWRYCDKTTGHDVGDEILAPSLQATSLHLVGNVPLEYHFNVTGATNWTPTLIKSNLVKVQLDKWYWSALPQDDVYVDYVGIQYLWTVPYEYEGVEPPPLPPVQHPGGLLPDFGGSWVMTVFIASLGFVGLVGMIGTPALMIRGHKKSEDKLDAFAGFIVIESLFIGMFYAAVLIAAA